MRVSGSLLSFARRLLPSVFGISKQGVRIEASTCPDPSSGCVVQVGEDACFVAAPTTTAHQVFGRHAHLY